MSIHLATPISKLTRVGAVTAKRLANLGIGTVKDLAALQYRQFVFVPKIQYN